MSNGLNNHTIGLELAGSFAALTSPVVVNNHNNGTTVNTDIANNSFRAQFVPAGPLYTLTVNATGASTFGGAVNDNQLTDNTATLTAGAITATGGIVINNSGPGTVTGAMAGTSLTKNG